MTPKYQFTSKATNGQASASFKLLWGKIVPGFSLKRPYIGAFRDMRQIVDDGSKCGIICSHVESL